MDPDRIAGLLQEAADLHHRVHRITDGADADWATWYADWLVRLSELPGLLGRPPALSELAWLLFSLDREPGDDAEPWEQRYARRIAEHFSV